MTGLPPLVLVGATLAGVGCGGDEPAPDESVADASGASGAVSGMMELDLETTITSGAHEESEELDGVDTAHRSGAANLRALLADFRRLTGMLGLPPPPLLGGPRESGTLDVFTGADDDVLRRLAVMIPRAGELEDGQAYEQEIKASLTLSEVDEAQEIEPPMDAPPVSDLEGGQVADKLSGLVEFLDDDDGPGRR